MNETSRIRWPPGHEPEGADIHCRNELTIAAPASEIWEVLVRADRWHEHYGNVRRVRHLEGPWPEMDAGTRWSWITFGIPVRTEIVDAEAPVHLAWTGEGLGARGCHAWALSPVEGGTLLVTEETQRGAAAKLLRQVQLPRMRRWHQRWLEGIASVVSSGGEE